MKKTILFFWLAASGIAATGQGLLSQAGTAISSHDVITLAEARKRALESRVQFNSNNIPAKPTSIQKRLVGWSFYDSNILTDSSAYQYSGTHTSAFRNVIDNFNGKRDVYDALQFPSLVIGFRGIPLEANDSAFSSQIMQADTSFNWKLLNGVPTLALAKVYTYDTTSGKIIKYVENNPEFEYAYILDSFVYNPAGKLLSLQQYDTAGGGTWVGGLYKTYNNAGKKVMDSLVLSDGMGNAVPDHVVKYDYDASGYLISSTFNIPFDTGWVVLGKSVYTNTPSGLPLLMESFEMDFTTMTLVPDAYGFHREWTYDASGRVLTAAELYTDIAMMGGAYKDSFAYTGNNPVYTYHAPYTWNVDSNKWGGINYAIHYSLNNAGNWDTLLYYEWNPETFDWSYIERDIIYYNDNNLISTIYGYGWDGTVHSAVPDFTDHYYYEDYEDGVPLGLKDKEVNGGAVKIYPNPSSGVIHIITAKPVDLLLQGLDGKSVLRCSNSNQMNISSLPPGVYLLKIMDTSGVYLKTEKIIKRP